MKKAVIIAEAGVNHNGNIVTAMQLIDVASKAKADYVKFQTFNADRLVSKNAAKAEYQKQTTQRKESQYEMIKKLELSESDHIVLIEYCAKKGIEFLSTPFDIESVDLLCKLGIEIIKIPSGEITNKPYLEHIGAKKKKIIISTGMADLKEIKAALDILTKAGSKSSNITVLHANTEYPTPYNDVNLRAMLTIGEKFNVDFGYSDHTTGIIVPIAAVSLGASVIEKHFTLSRELPGPDHRASLEPSELIEMVSSIRKLEEALGSDEKKPTQSEMKNMVIARKSIFISMDLVAGSELTKDSLVMKRPGDGISPMDIDKCIGRKLKYDLKTDSKLKWEDLL
jgi:N-acetylneuraminate synthase